MKYAIIQSSGKQYLVKEGETVTIDRVEKKEGETYLFEKVLLLRDGDSLKIGRPHLTGVRVKGKIEKQYKGEKLHVLKFKAKIRYRRKIGFRPSLTDIKIDKIVTSVAKTSPKKAKTAPRKKKKA